MATVGGVVSRNLRVDTQPKSLSLVWGLAASWVLRLNSSREPSELSRWQCHDNSTTWLSSVLRPLQHSIGYMEDGFYRSKDPTNSIKVLKEKAAKENNTKK